MNQQKNLAKEKTINWSIVDQGKFDRINRIQLPQRSKTKLKCNWDRKKHVYVNKGSCWVKLPNTDVLLEQGDSIDLQLGEAHQFENTGLTHLELIEIERMVLPSELEIEALEESLEQSRV